MSVAPTETRQSARRRMTSDERREQIISTAAVLFDGNGYSLTSMEDIGAALGIAKPTLYHYFASKADILVAIHDALSDYLGGRRSARAVTMLSGSQELFEMIVDLMELAESHPQYMRIWAEQYRELPEQALQTRGVRAEQYQRIMSEALERGIAEGTFRTVDPYVTAMQIIGMCVWSYQWLPQHSEYRGRDMALIFWSNIWAGLANENSTNAKP